VYLGDALVNRILKINAPEDITGVSRNFFFEISVVCFCHLRNKPFFDFVGVAPDKVNFFQLFKELLGLGSENFFFVGFHFSWLVWVGYGF